LSSELFLPSSVSRALPRPFPPPVLLAFACSPFLLLPLVHGLLHCPLPAFPCRAANPSVPVCCSHGGRCSPFAPLVSWWTGFGTSTWLPRRAASRPSGPWRILTFSEFSTPDSQLGSLRVGPFPILAPPPRPACFFVLVLGRMAPRLFSSSALTFGACFRFCPFAFLAVCAPYSCRLAPQRQSPSTHSHRFRLAAPPIPGAIHYHFCSTPWHYYFSPPHPWALGLRPPPTLMSLCLSLLLMPYSIWPTQSTWFILCCRLPTFIKSPDMLAIMTYCVDPPFYPRAILEFS